MASQPETLRDPPGRWRLSTFPRLLPVMMMVPIMMMVVVTMPHPHHDLSLGRDRGHAAEEEESEE